MEASAILKMVEDAFYNLFSIIDVIFRNDGSTIRAVIKHPYKGAQVQVMKSSKVKLDEEISELSFLADPPQLREGCRKAHIFHCQKK